MVFGMISYRKIQRNLWKLILIALLIGLYFWMTSDMGLNMPYTFKSSSVCKQPHFELWPENYKKFFDKIPAPIKCTTEDWVFTKKGHVYLTKNAKLKNATCYLSYIIRNKSDFKVERSKYAPLYDSMPLTDDFFEVKCTAANNAVYSSVMAAFVPKNHRYVKQQDMSNKKLANTPNILIFGFDSVSHATWLRLLPKSHDYFVNKLGGVVLEGYNIVGDGTPQALLPILTGYNETDLPEARRGFENAQNVDNHPWIWSHLRKLNYTTLYGEDGSSFGTFQYRMLGFQNAPTDHYMRPFYMVADAGKWERYCIGGQTKFGVMLNYLTEFHNSQKLPRFSFVFHSEYSHDSMVDLKLADNELLLFLQNINLHNTLLILMSDHGARFSQIRSSGEQGKFEERMPYMGLLLPDTWLKTHEEAFNNLRANVHTLTTPYDIHHTLLHATRQQRRFSLKKGQSLLELIPKNRTCETERIEMQWCSCLSWQPTDPVDVRILIAASAIVEAINSATFPYRSKCQELKLIRVLHSVMLSPKEELLRFVRSFDIHGRIPEYNKKEKSTDCDSALIPLRCVHG